VVGGGRRVPAFYLLASSVLLLLVSDAVYGWMQLAGTYKAPNFLDATWMTSYLLLGAAALHPSMGRLTEAAEPRARVVSPVRIAALAAAALVGPIALGVSNLFTEDIGRTGDVGVAVTTASVFVFVLLRLLGLMREQRRVHAQLSRREEELRDVVDALRRTEQERAHLFDGTVAAAEDERIRIAAELHDGPIQQLTALALTLDLIALKLERGDVTAVQTSLKSVRENVAEQMAELRRLMVELRPPALDEIGLEAALRDYVTDFERRVETRCEFVSDLGEVRLSQALETTFCRVAQEALTNIAKHAGAHRVRIELRREPGAVRLRVEDDGDGFVERPAAELVRNGHFGLVGMRDRIERAGGAWCLESRPGQGTILEAVTPAAEFAEARAA
jgi:signal transduction histidine kinase